MRSGLFLSMAALLAATGGALAEVPAPSAPTESVPATLPTPSQPEAPAPASASLAVSEGGASSSILPVAAASPASPAPAPATVPAEGGSDYPTGPAYNAPSVPGYYPYAGNPFYASSEFVLWDVKNGELPAFIFNAPIGVLAISFSDTTVNTVTGVETTNDFVGYTPVSINVNAVTPQADLNLGEHMGGRFTLGYVLDPAAELAVEATYLFVQPRSLNFVNTTDRARNQFMITTPFQERRFLFTPATGLVPATTVLQSTTAVLLIRETSSTLVGRFKEDLIEGAEVNVRSNCFYFGNMSFDTLAGFRWVNYNEELELTDTIRLFRPADVQRSSTDQIGSSNLSENMTINTFDFMRVRNNFYGAQVGATAEWSLGRFYLTGLAKAALGGIRQEVIINNSFSTSSPDADGVVTTVTRPGGLITGPGDIGRHDRYRIAWVPELNATVGYQVTPYLRAFAGYHLLWFHNMARTTGQFTVTSTTTQVQVSGVTQTFTVNTPAFRFNDRDMWAQGVNFGLEFRY